MFVAVRLLPSVALFAALLVAAIGCDVLLHATGMAPVGRWLGPIGVAFMAISFLYSLRKRGVLGSGSPKALLALHEVLAWVGTVLLLVHAGIHMNAWIPWLAVAALLIVAASGLVGRHLLAGARHELAGRRAALAAEGLTPDEVERRLLVSALLVRAMQRWRAVHMALNAVLLGLVAIHVAGTLLLW